MDKVIKSRNSKLNSQNTKSRTKLLTKKQLKALELKQKIKAYDNKIKN